MGRKGAIGCFFIGFLLVCIFIGFAIYDYFTHYVYEKNIGSYMETATDTITPESFKEQLFLFKEAINQSGLTESDYGAIWFKKPDNSMKFQIQHIDSIIERANAMIQWQEASYNTTSQPIYASPEAFRDVYNEKMNNLRLYIHAEGYRSDWIAEKAWFVKYHRFLCFSFIIYIFLALLIIVFFMIGGALWD